MRILYVENHARFAKVTAQEFLSSHEVVIVASLAVARQAQARGGFEAVLLDYDLDDGKGVELVEALHCQGARPVIIATSSHEAGNAALLRAGADAVCSKMNFKNIEQAIANVCKTRGV